MQKRMMNIVGITVAALSLCACKPGIYYPFGAAKTPQQIQAKQAQSQTQAYVNNHADDYAALVPVDQNGTQTVKPTKNRLNIIIPS